jgi:ornithine cyclodeaminase
MGLSWAEVTGAIAAGHRLPKARLGDLFLRRDPDTVLTRAAVIDGLGTLVKTATVFPGNAAAGKPTVQGGACLYADGDGAFEAVIDFGTLTRLKTAGDSLLAAQRLAPPQVRRILIVGAGDVAASMVEAYRSLWPAAQVAIWARRPEPAAALAATLDAEAVADLPAAATAADILCCATMATAPVLRGDWLRPGQHVDLIGAYRADMREADDVALRRARLFADSFDTTLDHIGEFRIPLAEGVIARSDVLADFYDPDAFVRAPEDITLCKNGGGAHLDLMVGRLLYHRTAGSSGRF